MKFKGIAVSEGFAAGPVYRYMPYSPNARPKSICAGEAPEAVGRYLAAREKAREELEALRQKTECPDRAAIFQAHLDILSDIVITVEIRALIETELISEDWAVHGVFTRYSGMLEQMDDELFRERASDMRDVKNRLLRCLDGSAESSLSLLAVPSIIIAHELLPSDTAMLNREMTLGIITETGGATSHSAIIARGYGIPAVLGVKGAMAGIADGDTVILNAADGEVLVNPRPDEVTACIGRQRAFQERKRLLDGCLSQPPVTRDGVYIEVALNIGVLGKDELNAAEYADGAGLFRTEFVFMNRAGLPDEEEQVRAYAKAFAAFGKKPVVVRTLDAGGDKIIGALHMPPEDNPFLGSRALRLCFQNPELFNTQLRACLRAAANGCLWLMFPMVGSIEDIRKAKLAVKRAESELEREGYDYARSYKTGIMIEIPSIALMAEEAAAETDFAGIGTNDLTQYMFAADRMNPEVSQYCQKYHPAVFRLIGHAAAAFAKHGKPIGVCGELGGDALAVAPLIGLGVNKLSMGPSAMAGAKKIIRGLTMPKARAIAEQARAFATARETEDYLRREFDILSGGL